jgi:hypothetical protein
LKSLAPDAQTGVIWLARNLAMTSEKISAAVVACGLLLSSSVCLAQDRRGPSTAEERQQALEYIHSWQADPLGPEAKEKRAWVLKWLVDVPDLTVHLCSILDKLPKGDKKDSSTLFTGMFMAQAAFVIDNPDKQDQRIAEYEAGVEGALRVYEALVKANPKDREAYLDDLIARRDAGTLAQYVEERADASCKN